MRLLLVEDSDRLTELMKETVHGAGWRIDAVSTAEDARNALKNSEHDLLVLDIGLPDGNGLDLLREIREADTDLPVLIVTAMGDVDSRIAGLDAGADDYLAKPFHHREFLARCRALARRSGSGTTPVLTAGHLRYDPATASLSCDGTAIQLPPRERQLAELLMREVDRVVSKRRLETALSEFDEILSTNALELAVSRLRKKFAEVPAGAVIETVRGIGYMLRTVG
ncbi:response regulator transcription factor [Jiella sp. M17.18]|uniref:response regulator transcription factor n=1 Tax=Jiella sp. M17.18 TaxID=3234247 RepID=UPI0034DFF050